MSAKYKEGKVIWFASVLGYGFAKIHGYRGIEIYFHKNAVRYKAGQQNLISGQAIKCHVVPDRHKKGFKAVDVILTSRPLKRA